jgi:hypothetical protein
MSAPIIKINFSRFKPLLNLRQQRDKIDVFDPIRKRFVRLLPEELIRQLVVHYLIEEKKYLPQRLRVEVGFKVLKLSKRCDILIYDNELKPALMVECKSAHVPLNQAVFDQIARYNLPYKVPILVVTNGMATFCCRYNTASETYDFLTEIPEFSALV